MTKPDLTNTAPKRIYLDIGDQFALERVASGALRWDLLDGVTWSEDNATSHGIPYVRADLVPTPAASGAAPALPTDAMIHAAAHAFDVSNATFLVKMRCALSAALARQEAAQPADDGYATAFYEIASVLGIGARADTPENVFRNEMLPRIVALACREASPAPLTDEQIIKSVSPHLIFDDGPYGDNSTNDVLNAARALLALASPQVAPAPEPAAPTPKGTQMDSADSEVIRVMEERDAREEIIDQLCAAVLGPDREEWSSGYGYGDAVADVEERMATLSRSEAETIACEDCGGCGEVGEAVYQGAFQPPERDRCESCQGSGLWEISLTPAERAARAIEKTRDDYAAIHGKESGDAREHFDMLTEMAAKARASNLPAWDQGGCAVPPVGWWCSRAKGHEGPCAARPVTLAAPVQVAPQDDARDAAEAIDAELPAYPTGDVIGPCVCGSWPGGPCLKCPAAKPTEPTLPTQGEQSHD